MAEPCPTCVMLDALMASRGFTKGERSIAYSEPVRRTDRKVRKRTGTALKGMSAAMKKANKKAKLKNGKFRKGWNQSKLMKYAHKIRGKK